MLQIPKAVVQIPEQDPQGMGSIYFSLENQISLVQASQTPDNTIKMHTKEGSCLVPSCMNKEHMDKLMQQYYNSVDELNSCTM